MADLTGMLQAAAGAGGEVDNAWNISAATVKVSPINGFYFGIQDATPDDITFKTDGTKMYMVGRTNDFVYEYNLSTAWDVGTASYVQSFSVTSQDTSPNGIAFKTDGTKMYVCGLSSDSVHEYALSTAWDISSASFTQSYSVASQDTSAQSIYIKSDGTKMFVLGSQNDSVYEYTLNTAWSLSSVTYVQSFSVTSQEATPFGVFFKDDGTKMYIVGTAGDDVNEYALSTAWNISTASFTASYSTDVAGNPSGIHFKSDGSVMYVSNLANDAVQQFALSTAWDVTSASFTYPTSGFGSIVGNAHIFIRSDGLKLYSTDSDNQVREYDLSTAWDTTTASLVNTELANLSPGGIAFNADGTKMFIVYISGDAVYTYPLSTAWDVSTQGTVTSADISVNTDAPSGLFFKPDGTKMYVSDTTLDSIVEYSLSTAFDLTTLSYNGTFSVASQTTVPNSVFFKDDGTKMYVNNGLNSSVYEYDLSTAWDVTSASYSQSFDGASRWLGIASSIGSIFFKSDGTQLYTLIPDQVWEYDL